MSHALLNISASRSTSELASMVADRLRASRSPLLARRVQCSVFNGVITLHGRLPSFYLKQVAQTIAKNVPGVNEIANRIVVVRGTAISDLGRGERSPTS